MAGEAGTLTRRFSLASLVAVAFAALALASAPTAAAQESLAASCEPPRDDVVGFSLGGPLGNNAFAQTFTSAITGTLIRAQIDIFETESQTANYVVEIWSVDENGVPAAPLATTTVADAPPGDSLINAVFTSPASVAAGTQYALVISRPAGSQLFIGQRSGDECEGTLRSGLTSSGWAVGSPCGAPCDMVFRVFVIPVPSARPVPQPAPQPAPQPTFTCGGQRATIVGTTGADRIVGTSGPDVIAALGGNDTVRGGDGEDLICGNRGKDQLRGQDGEDKLFGARGKDRLFGGAAADLLVGGAKGDSLFGGGGKDKLRGGSPNAPGKDAPDLCRGGAASDKLKNCER